MYVRRTGTRRDAMRWTRLTPAAGGTDPTRAAAPARASPAGTARRARRRTRAARTRRAARRGSAWDHPRAIHRATHEARGAAKAEERTAAAERTRTGPGMPADRGPRPEAPQRLATPAATPLRARPIMKSTPTLRIAVDDDVAPRRSMKGLGPEVLLEVREARAAAAPPLRPGSQETAAPARTPRTTVDPGRATRTGPSRWGGTSEGGSRADRIRPGSPKRPAKSGNRAPSAGRPDGPRRAATPRAPASACTHAARRTLRIRPRPWASDARRRARRATRNAGAHGRNASNRPTGSARASRRGTRRTRDPTAPRRAPRAARATAWAPSPRRSIRWPGRTPRAVSSEGAPKKTEGTKSKTAWLAPVETMNTASRRGTASASGDMGRDARTRAQAAWVETTRAATLFTWSPGDRPVTSPAARPRRTIARTRTSSPRPSTAPGRPGHGGEALPCT